MTALLEEARRARPAAARPLRTVLRWAAELALLIALYDVYARVRDLHGVRSAAHVAVAQANGLAIARFERTWHLNIEHAVQHLVLGHRTLVLALNGFYGGAHFAVTIAVLVALAVRGGRDFRFWRRTLVLATFAGVAVFALHATMPPRLLPPPFRTVDTLQRYGGLWSYDDGSLEHIADPFAALPSLHLVWAGWCAAVGWHLLRRRWLRLLAVAYPCVTTFAVIATGNHFIVDVVAGLAVLAAAIGVSRVVDVAGRRCRRSWVARSGRPLPPP